MKPQLSLLYTTFPDQEEALRISQILLKRNLIACANIMNEIQSLYLWEGQLENNKEIAVLYKTTIERISELIAALEDLHPYDTPALLEIPLGRVSEPFTKWVQAGVR